MKTLVICSGGIDSVATAILHSKDDLTLMFFDYGQKGIKEKECVINLSKELEAEYIEVDISFMKKLYGDNNQLTSEEVEVNKDYTSSVVVPLRNGVFLQIAMAFAHSHEFDQILLGSHLNDIEEVNGERLYPDCSPEFYLAFELTSKLGTFRRDKKVKVVSASLQGMSKTDLIMRAEKERKDLIFHTWSCYRSGKYHCGECESCQNRKKAFSLCGIPDKTQYES